MFGTELVESASTAPFKESRERSAIVGGPMQAARKTLLPQDDDGGCRFLSHGANRPQTQTEGALLQPDHITRSGSCGILP
jgi:hypothetical protein